MNFYSMLLFVICITFRALVKIVHSIEIEKTNYTRFMVLIIIVPALKRAWLWVQAVKMTQSHFLRKQDK